MSQFRCPECGFIQGYLTLHAHTGAVSDNPGPSTPPRCPNDGTPLERVTDDDDDDDDQRRLN